MKFFITFILPVILIVPICRAQSSPPKTIHVFVALCDNESQGIVPVPAALGNGDDPANNLYWGAMYGVKTYFKKSNNWLAVADSQRLNSMVMERLVFKHRTANVYLVADAYRGNRIKSAIEIFLQSAAGNRPSILRVGETELGLYGNAELIAYVGHNGLMEFGANPPIPNPHRQKNNAAIILACKSRPYFERHILNAGCTPLLLTNGFMAPEAYTLEAAANAWANGSNPDIVLRCAAEAYDKYQRCGINGACRLFEKPAP